MPTSLRKVLRVFLFIFGPFALPLQSFAQDQSNAANVDATTWSKMYQVMSGTSTTSPDTLGLNILTPQGLYVIIDAHLLYDTVAKNAAAMGSGVSQDTAFYNYLYFILSQPGVAGILFAAPWSMLNPNDPNTGSSASTADGCPGTGAANTADVYVWNALDDAFCAINQWNKDNSSSTVPPKTLQLAINPGASSPAWLFQSYLSSCDFLFEPSIAKPTNPADCGYTMILDIHENDATAATLPMPWNNTYKTEWKEFLNALNNHIKGQGAQGFVVSINVTGPTMLSGEMILPHDVVSTLPTGYTSLPTGPGAQGNAAWNCLFANYYGAAPASGANYVNSDRAFIEEWAAAIDLYGEIFSGLTLTVATGNGLPDFSKEGAGTVTCRSGQTISVVAPAVISPPPAFAPDCAVQPPNKVLHPMDCAAETAVLAYFAEPSVGGPNAKATQEDALAASDDVVDTLLTLSNASVKWLSQTTAGGLAPVPDGVSIPLSPPPPTPVMSRMLGGLNLAGPVFRAADPNESAAKEGCPTGPCPYCSTTSGCEVKKTCLPTNICNVPPNPPQPQAACKEPPGGFGGVCTPVGTLPSGEGPGYNATESALLNVLIAYFSGTSAWLAFGNEAGFPNGAGGAYPTVQNTTAAVSNAPLNYLQVWYNDFEYAAGWGTCDRTLIMTHAWTDLTKNAKTLCPYDFKTHTGYTAPSKMPTVPLVFIEGGLQFQLINAQDMLAWAGANIPTTKPLPLPLFGYNNPKLNTVCACNAPAYVQRGAFVGDDVCVPTADQTAALNQNATPNFANNESKDGINYGPCNDGFVWRQAYMGDYVCVSSGDFTQIVTDNLAGKANSTCHP